MPPPGRTSSASLDSQTKSFTVPHLGLGGVEVGDAGGAHRLLRLPVALGLGAWGVAVLVAHAILQAQASSKAVIRGDAAAGGGVQFLSQMPSCRRRIGCVSHDCISKVAA